MTDRIQLTPVAIREAHAFADSVFGNKPWTVDYDCVPSAVFANPPLGSVGMTEAHARNTLGTVKVFTSDFRPMRNVLAGRNERSLYKLVVDSASDRVVGAHMIGPGRAGNPAGRRHRDQGQADQGPVRRHRRPAPDDERGISLDALTPDRAGVG